MHEDIRDDWKIRDIERKADEASRRLHELDSLRSDVGSLERSLREARSETDGLRNELQANQERTARLEERLDELTLNSS